MKQYTQVFYDHVVGHYVTYLPGGTQAKAAGTILLEHGYPLEVAGGVCAGALVTLRYQAARDGRLEVLQDIKTELNNFTKLVDQQLAHYTKQHTWEMPKVLVAPGRHFELEPERQADVDFNLACAVDSKAHVRKLNALVTDWKYFSPDVSHWV